MKSQNFGYIPALDHLRGFAAVLVALFHGVLYVHHRLLYGREFDDTNWLVAPDPISAVIIEGHTAVALFFVLSGFIFASGLLDRELRYSQFLKNRFLRTYPLLLALIRRFGPAVLLLLVAIVLRWSVYSEGADMRWYSYWSLLGRIDQFLAGMLAGYFYIRHFRQGRSMDVLGVISAGLVLTSLFIFNRMGGGSAAGPVWVLWPTAEGISWSVFLIGYLSLARHLNQWLDFRLASLGKISYSIYFIHYVVLFYLMTNNLDGTIVVGGPVDRALINTVILVLPPTVVLAWLSFRFIEQPFLSLRGRYLNDRA